MLAWIESPHPGFTTTTRGVGGRGHLELLLADPDGLHQHHVESHGREDPHGVGHGDGQAAQVAPRGHRADVHTVVEGVGLHADPVAEDGATRVGEDGSMASTPMAKPPSSVSGRLPAAVTAPVPASAAPVRPRTRPAAIIRSVSVDFPAPGAPVMPTE